MLLMLLLMAEWVSVPFAAVPLVTATALVSGTPSSPASRPRAILGSHALALSLGALCLLADGMPELPRTAVAFAAFVGLAQQLDVMHPPAASIVFLPFVPIHYRVEVAAMVVAGSIALAATASFIGVERS